MEMMEMRKMLKKQKKENAKISARKMPKVSNKEYVNNFWIMRFLVCLFLGSGGQIFFSY